MKLGVTLGNVDVWALAPAWGHGEKLIDSHELVSKPAFGTRTFLRLAILACFCPLHQPTPRSPHVVTRPGGAVY